MPNCAAFGVPLLTDTILWLVDRLYAFFTLSPHAGDRASCRCLVSLFRLPNGSFYADMPLALWAIGGSGSTRRSSVYCSR